MIDCKELAGKTVRSFTLYEDAEDGPSISIEFTDGVTFSASLSLSARLEAKCTLDEGGQPQVLQEYCGPEITR